ncbi:response regulator transcription factor [Novosphingobium lindaniclasticum]|nr:response regulator [Novosphingobium lindaniclasticum]
MIGTNSPQPDGSLERQPLVLIVDDDEIVRRTLDSLLRSTGLRTATYASAQELLDMEVTDDIGCIILDVRLPRLSGLELQTRLRDKGDERPLIFITGHADVPMSVRAMKAGAVDFLQKPFRDQDLLDAVDAALARDRVNREQRATISSLRARYDLLTPRERQVMELVSSGLLNKQAANELGLSEITVKLHRASVMKKMEAKTVAQLVRMAEMLERSL